MNIYLVTVYFDYEGYGEVVKGFKNMDKAYDLKEKMLEWKKNGRNEKKWKEGWKSFYFDDLVVQEVKLDE